MRTCDKTWLAKALHEDSASTPSASAMVLDCRDPEDFSKGHIKSAINVALPTLLFRRLLKGTLSPVTAICRKNPRNGYDSQDYKKIPLVLVDDRVPCDRPRSLDCDSSSQTLLSGNTDLCTALYRSLAQEGCDVCVLAGIFFCFFF